LEALRIPPLAGKSFLDIGCNEGFFCNYALQQGATRVVGIDSQKAAIDKAREYYPGVTFLHQSWDKLPDEKFDVILHASAMHYASDPYSHIERIRNALSDNGLLILEIGYSSFNHNMESGIFEIGGAFWERSNRGFDTVFHPSEALLRSDLLLDFSVRAVGPSVIQPGDRLLRKVYHCYRFLPIAILVEGGGSGGKTTTTVELQRHGVPTVSTDFVIEVLRRNAGGNVGPLWAAVKDRTDPNRGGVQLYEKLNEPGLASSFAEEIVRMMPKRQRILVLEGYAFTQANIRDETIRVLRAKGFKVHRLVIEQ